MMKKGGTVFVAAFAACMFYIAGFGPERSISASENTNESIEWKTVVSIKEEAVPLASKPAVGGVRVPKASGTVTFNSNSVLVDASNTGSGYVMVQYSGDSQKIKVQVIKSGGETYTYDLNSRSAYEVFPLTEGNGSYTVRVLEQVQGTQYAIKSSNQLQVNLTNEFEPFLYPNQYVNFSSGSAVVAKGAELAASAPDSLGVVTNVYNYVVKNFTYDTALANSVQSGYLPNVDQVLAKKKGICFDYAAVMTSMLRSQGIPTKLVVGYTGSLYHAWVNVYIEGQGWVDNVIYFDGYDWKLMDPTFASSGGNDPSIKEYITKSTNYKGKYTY
jgi:hypothetical protein